MIVSSGLKYILQISITQNLKKYLKKAISGVKNVIIWDVPNGIIKFYFQHLKQNLISNNTSQLYKLSKS